MSSSNKAIFLSYASQDADAAKKICEALRSAGVEVWFDADGGLEHGDEWDAKIRRQIRDCILFIPIVSASTQARLEGYFRIEWALAAERAVGIADGVPFVLPVVIDDTREPEALVPDRFRKVQWIRLPGGVVTPQVQQRLLKLWSHRAGVLRHEEGKIAGGGDRRVQVDFAAGSGFVAWLSRHRTLFIISLVGAALVTAAAIWTPWKRDHLITPGSTAPKAGTPASRPEVAALLARVRALSAKTDVVRTELDTAAGLLEQAAKLDPTDANVWAEWALVDRRYVDERFDRSPARLDSARRHATRSVGLDPANPLARFADASTMVLLHNDAATKQAAIEILEPLADRVSDHGGVLFLLASLKWDPARPQAAFDYWDRAARIPGWAGRAEVQRSQAYFSTGQFQQAEDAIDRALATERAAYFVLSKAFFLAAWHGDIAGAKRIMAEVPAALLAEDFPASGRYFVELRARDYDSAVAALRAIPRDYMESFALPGPTGYYKGYALARAGKPAAAEIEWRSALDVVARRLSERPNDRDLLLFKALLLAALGDRTAGEKLWRSTRELFGNEGRSWPEYFSTMEFMSDEAAIERLADMASKAQSFALAASLRMDPYVDRLRSHQKFIELLARVEADPRLSPKANAVAKAAQSLPADSKSVAVLAFENLSGDKDNEYFSDGISEELLNVLAKVPGLRVAARTSAFYFKGKYATAQEIGQKLGVAHLVDGSVRRAGTKVRIAARLSKADTGEQLWSESYEEEFKDIFALQDKIARDIAPKLQLKLAPNTGTQREVNPEAHVLYLEGRHYWNQRTDEGFRRAEAAFNKALRIDPEFARAHAGLADLWTSRGWDYTNLDALDAPVALAKAKAAATRALDLDPNLAEMHATFGAIHMVEGRNNEARRELETCLDLRPNYATARNWHGDLMLRMGKLDAAIEDFLSAARLDPLSLVIVIDCASHLVTAQRHAEALEFADRSVALGPGLVQPAIARVQAMLGLGGRDEAADLLRGALPALQAVDVTRTNSPLITHLLRRAGLNAEAEEFAAREMNRLTPDSFVRGFLLAALGRFDEALPALERMPASATFRMFWNPIFDSFRDEPRFQSLMVKLGRAEEYKVARETLARMLRELTVTAVKAGKQEPKK